MNEPRVTLQGLKNHPELAVYVIMRTWNHEEEVIRLANEINKERKNAAGTSGVDKTARLA